MGKVGVARSIKKIGAILTSKPAMVKQVTNYTLNQIPGGDVSTQANMTARKELADRLASGNIGDSYPASPSGADHTYRTPRKSSRNS